MARVWTVSLSAAERRHVWRKAEKGTVAVNVCLVYRCHRRPCVYLQECVFYLHHCGGLLWGGGGFATAVMDAVSVDHLSFHLGGQAAGLAGDEVLLFLAHQPVVHGALGSSGDVIAQPAFVPLVEALVLAGRYAELRLRRKAESQLYTPKDVFLIADFPGSASNPPAAFNKILRFIYDMQT